MNSVKNKLKILLVAVLLCAGSKNAFALPPSAGVSSRIITVYDYLDGKGFGNDSAGFWGDYGKYWNRVYSASNVASLITTTPEYSSGSPNSTVASKIMALYTSLVDADLGSDDAGSWGNWGVVWNRIYSATRYNCAAGWTLVPGDSLYGTDDFCVMKYEAKCDTDGDGTGENASGDHADCNTTYDTWGNILSGCRCIEDKGGQIVSSAAGAPIARIAQDAGGSGVDAKTYCQSQGWELISNDQWMTIVRNVESQGANWCATNGTGCGNSPGSQYLVSGHNDKGGETGTAKALQASSDDTQGCYNTTTDGSNNCGGTGSQRRTHYLSNGQVIWDLAGNLWQWTDDTIMGADKPAGGASWVEWTTVSDYGSLTYDDLKPSNNTWNSTQRVGKYYQGSATGGPYAFLRGAHWYYGTRAGVSTLNLVLTPGNSGHYTIGFRCVWAF
jgi:hypothetical protein